MILFTLILAFLSALVYADLSQLPANCDLASPDLTSKFNQFKSRTGKKYKDQKDEKERSDRFKRRCCEIDYLNSQSLSEGGAEFRTNQFSDWKDEEFAALLGGRLETSSEHKRYVAGTYDKPVPTTVTNKNWCTDGYCSPVKDQKSCGSCWAYATTAAYESAVAIKFGLKGSSVPVYSPQYLLDCNNVTSIRQGSSSCWKGNGCNGGPLSFGYIKEKGHFTAVNYPASSDLMQKTCTKANTIAADIGLTGWVDAQTASEDQIAANLVEYGPIPALVCADQWQNYASGILTKAQCTTCKVNHAVVIVGLTPTEWIIRNSWGASWGEAGFIRIPRGQGACSITGYAYLVPPVFIPDGPSPPPPPPASPPPSSPPPSTPSTCKATGCLTWPQTIGAITMTTCSNLPVYNVPTSSTGVCITSIKQTSTGTSFGYKNCPTTCGTNPPTFVASSAYGGNKKDNGKIVAVEEKILAINSETGATFTPSDSPLPVYIGAGVVALVALVVIVVIVVLVKRRANQEEIV